MDFFKKCFIHIVFATFLSATFAIHWGGGNQNKLVDPWESHNFPSVYFSHDFFLLFCSIFHSFSLSPASSLLPHFLTETKPLRGWQYCCSCLVIFTMHFEISKRCFTGHSSLNTIDALSTEATYHFLYVLHCFLFFLFTYPKLWSHCRLLCLITGVQQ